MDHISNGRQAYKEVSMSRGSAPRVVLWIHPTEAYYTNGETGKGKTPFPHFLITATIYRGGQYE
jgi:hypothetical protein